MSQSTIPADELKSVSPMVAGLETSSKRLEPSPKRATMFGIPIRFGGFSRFSIHVRSAGEQKTTHSADAEITA